MKIFRMKGLSSAVQDYRQRAWEAVQAFSVPVIKTLNRGNGAA